MRAGEAARGAFVGRAFLDRVVRGGARAAVFRRTGDKYRDRSDRCALADLGHALESLRLAAATLDAMPTDPARERVVHLAALGVPSA